MNSRALFSPVFSKHTYLKSDTVKLTTQTIDVSEGKMFVFVDHLLMSLSKPKASL